MSTPDPEVKDLTLKRKREEDDKTKERKEVSACSTSSTDAHPTVQGVEGAKGAVAGSFVGATCLWLVCDNYNRAIASLERLGLINRLQAWVDETPSALADLHTSHARYESYVTTDLLPEETARRFVALHATPQKDGTRKYGNAGTANPARVKCLHAHTATFLSGLPNPVGYVVFHTLRQLEKAHLSSPDDVADLASTVLEGYSKETAGVPLTEDARGEVCQHIASLIGTPDGEQQVKKRRRKKRLN